MRARKTNVQLVHSTGYPTSSLTYGTLYVRYSLLVIRLEKWLFCCMCDIHCQWFGLEKSISVRDLHESEYLNDIIQKKSRRKKNSFISC